MTVNGHVDVSEPRAPQPSARRTGKHIVLFLAANPLGTDRLALDDEARAIQHELERSSWQHHFELVTRWAAQPLDLLRELRTLKPAIVHFSGHGGSSGHAMSSHRNRDVITDTSAEGGLVFQDPDGRPQIVSTDALKTTFEAAGASVKLVVLSACYSEVQGEALLAHVGCVIGVRGPMRDDAARTFAIGFYGGLAERESVGVAFKQGVAAIRLAGLPDEMLPDPATARTSALCEPLTRLLAQPCVDPDRLYFVHEPHKTRRCSIVIKAKLADFDPEVIARVRDELRRLTGDVSLEILEVQEGSVRLTVSLTPEAAKRLEALRDDGQLTRLCRFEVSSVRVERGVYVHGQKLGHAVEPNEIDFSPDLASAGQLDPPLSLGLAGRLASGSQTELAPYLADIPAGDLHGSRPPDQGVVMLQAPTAGGSEQTATSDDQPRDARRRMILGFAVVAAISLAAILYRGYLRAKMTQEVAEATITQAEIEQGRQALLHVDSAEAQTHLWQAYQRGARTPDVEFMLARALQPRMVERARLQAPYGRMWSARFSPDGARIVTAGEGGAEIWDAKTYRLLFSLLRTEVDDAAYAGDVLITASSGAVQVWSPATGTLLRDLRPAHGRASSHVRLAVAERLVATIDPSGAVAHVWDLRTGAELAELHNAALGRPSLAFSSDGRWLAMSSGEDVRVFDTATRKQVTTIAKAGRALAFDPTGARLVTGTSGGDAAVWTIPDATRIHHLREAGDPIDHVAFAPSGALIAIAGADSLQVWNAGTGILRFQTQTSKPHSIEFDASSKSILAASGDGSVSVFDTRSGTLVSRLEGPQQAVHVAHFDPSSQRVISAARDGTVRVWDAAPPYLRRRSVVMDGDCKLLGGVEPDQRVLAIGCPDRPTRIWDTARDRLLTELPGIAAEPSPGFAPVFPAVSRAGDRAAIAREHTVEVYAVSDGRLMRTITHDAPVSAVAFRVGGRDLVTGAMDGSVWITRDESAPLALPRASSGIDAVLALRDGRVLAADEHTIRFYSGGQLQAEFALAARVRALRPSPDGRRLAAIPRDAGPVPLWDLDRRVLLRPLAGHVGQVHAVRWIDDRLFTAGADGTVRSWDGETGGIRQVLRGPRDGLMDVTIDPSGPFVVAGGHDGALHFWDIASGRLLWSLPAHSSPVIGIAFEGSDIVTQGAGGDVARWSLAPAKQVIEQCIRSAACDVAPR